MKVRPIAELDCLIAFQRDELNEVPTECISGCDGFDERILQVSTQKHILELMLTMDFLVSINTIDKRVMICFKAPDCHIEESKTLCQHSGKRSFVASLHSDPVHTWH